MSKKIPLEKQHDLKDCGACSLSCIIKYYDGYVPLEKIREDTCTSTTGTTAFHLVKAATSYGFESLGVKVKSIHDPNIYLPAIAHLILKNGLQHFVVIYKINKNYVWLMDPAKGKVKMPISEFLEVWDNILLLFSPTGNIAYFEKNITIPQVVVNLLKANKKTFTIIVLTNILFMILSVISSFYFQTAVSSLNEGIEQNFLKFIILVFGIVTIFKVLINYLKNYYMCYLNKNLDTEVFTEFLSHIFNLPLSFIQNRTTGEITSRVAELNDIKNLLAEIFTSLILNSILIIGSGVTLYFISAKLFFILCLIISIYTIISLIFGKIIYQKLKVNIEKETDFNSTLVENLSLNCSIKNLNIVKEFLSKLENKLILMLKHNFLFQKFLNNIESSKNFIYEIGLFLITTYGIYLISIKDLQVLNLITFNSLILYLFNPIKDIMDIIPKYNYLKASFNKLSELLNVDIEECNKGLKTIPNFNIVFRNVSYSYNKIHNILNNLNFVIKEGEKVLLSGPSGSGKSTICKLLTRGLTNYGGFIGLGNLSEQDYALNTIRQSILYVGQNEKLFTGTIKENITSYRNISESEFLSVCKITKVDEIIAKKPNRYNSLINASINNLSGGERQRIILARALLKKSKIIILDEALSEVNITMEKEILDNIFKKYPNKTLIYVTHKNVQDKFTKIIKVGAYKC